MQLYHYAKKGNTILSDGILSFATNPKADLHYYQKRSGTVTHQGIVAWMEECFKGRSRGIRCFSEPIKWTAKSIHCLKDFVDACDMFAIDITAIQKDGLIEAVYVSPPITDFPDLKEEPGMDEVLQKLNSTDDIDYSPIDWSVCDDETGKRFAFVRYYLLIIKGGIIPPKYIKKIE